jgi:putative SOS response-associated peptidase YedK
MCGRSSLTKTEKEIEERFNATFYSDELERYNPLPSFNAAPTQMLPVIISEEPDRIHLFRWGLIPFWAKDKSIGSKMINARAETLLEKPSFRSLVSRHRCIVPLDGFYEWQKQDHAKVPYRIITTDNDIFAAAGLWDRWIDTEQNKEVFTFTIITTAPNTLMQPIHDRMPAILLREDEVHWLDAEVQAKDAIELLHPYPAEHMRAYRVSTMVNNVRNNTPDLILPVGETS